MTNDDKSASVGMGPTPGLTFDELHRANKARCTDPKEQGGFDEPLNGMGWSPVEWACAVAEEAGEVCGAALGVEGLKGSKSGKTDQDVADELADVVLYADLLATRIGRTLGSCIADKFNRTSEKRGSKHRLSGESAIAVCKTCGGFEIVPGPTGDGKPCPACQAAPPAQPVTEPPPCGHSEQEHRDGWGGQSCAVLSTPRAQPVREQGEAPLRCECWHIETPPGMHEARCPLVKQPSPTAGPGPTEERAHDLATTGATMYCLGCGEEWDLPSLVADDCTGKKAITADRGGR